MRALACLILAAGLSLTGTARALGEDALIAVATNFAGPAEALADRFESETGHVVRIATGSTGALYAQIRQGAPFDAFLAADQASPARLVQDGLAEGESLQTYAIGRLVLVSAQDRSALPLDQLRTGDFDRLALANTDLAPYGRAAEQVLSRLRPDLPAGRMVRGQNIAQTLAIFATGNADLAFIARSQLDTLGPAGASLIPSEWHDPIKQDAVLLRRGTGNPAAEAWMVFLSGPGTAEILDAYGYGAAE